MYDSKSATYMARSQLGYREGTTRGIPNNIQKYSQQVPGMEWSNGQPWCSVFVDWLYTQCGILVPTGAISASCEASCMAYKNAGRFTEYPVVGGKLFLGPKGGTHTEYVIAYDDIYVTSIGGNTNANGSATGDGVYQNKRVRRIDYVYGYGIPYLKGLLNTPDPRWGGREGSV